MVLEWTLSKRLGLAYSKIDLLCCSVSLHLKEKHESIFQYQSTGYLRTRGQEPLYETSAACALSLKRASETQNHHLMDTRASRDRRLEV